MNFTERQIGLLENAVFLWLTVLPPVSTEVQKELGELLDALSKLNEKSPAAEGAKI